jgi:hypothetical protein
MGTVSDRRIALFERVLRDPGGVNPGDLAIETSKLQATGEQTFEQITVVIAEWTHSLIDSDRKDAQGHAAFLIITAVEKSQLEGKLNRLAGPNPANTDADASRLFARIPAVVLWRWLQQGWGTANR